MTHIRDILPDVLALIADKVARRETLTQQEAAALLGVSRGYVYELERAALHKLRHGLSELLTDEEWVECGLRGVPRATPEREAI
jgi:hypothetical protein